MKNICILGATGSIGTQTLEVIREEKENLKLYAASANKSSEKIISIIEEFEPKYVSMTDKEAFLKVKEFCMKNNKNTEVLYGIEGMNTIASLDKVDIVLTSVVGMIGLEPTLKAIRNKKDIALANKETLVVAGEIIKKEAHENKVNILPVDSEHGAIFQCLLGNLKGDINKIHLTASGGPFRGKKREELENVTVEQALKHPNWNMGKKISIDSATLMNKGLEVIEAHFLFDVDYEDIEVVVHPESIIHSMVEYKDGSVIAQLASPDMKLPIQYALNYPIRKDRVIEKLNLFEIEKLTFYKPDLKTFKCLDLAYRAGKIGGMMPTILNSSNEYAVELFLNKKIGFLEIPKIIEECMKKFYTKEEQSVEKIIHMDKIIGEYIREKYN
ncbi:1-deoxy-D-xylulose 5-phosphate reductoisomerase [Clostridium tetani]|uniref:1-deoxy-D-xylulose 5-phosphate reductoisomerase n=1 Tax=Clostridium tetani (strain Massachusetts / E88) TaxID=212717 RepID=DXR_CLOTE|nr:1-deoxy-D-xylulose-5-phosphate reductoisomerase [Clostridium tetani]Q895K5.1 RecName: Full=1-deoxy-D-xylulose 5-phosphate reductoisomerase; Short=DXP reductoisomerase; AltName: Full=1-deoxyxylulose-5-phosphate reductoisomerase; AltName: Full=2-C-methyl-D-erythritol 4-phosphate synthase [Clostridium tetani E88]AAO35835.1 1-deoxy-d-xylulose 5-phosphate reductoisomerase [Clostridium tetani E88]AVP53728.1 1-deoxy-D-xylulose-5-phosphate reductoisomerase [Clostridium tetani]KGI38263.1 1-deoxy-D-xy